MAHLPGCRPIANVCVAGCPEIERWRDNKRRYEAGEFEEKWIVRLLPQDVIREELKKYAESSYQYPDYYRHCEVCGAMMPASHVFFAHKKPHWKKQDLLKIEPAFYIDDDAFQLPTMMNDQDAKALYTNIKFYYYWIDTMKAKGTVLIRIHESTKSKLDEAKKKLGLTYDELLLVLLTQKGDIRITKTKDTTTRILLDTTRIYQGY